MKKLSAKEICMAIAVAGVALCLVIYMLVFRKYQEETDTLKASNRELEAQVNDLKQYYDNIPLYRKSIEEMKALVAEVTADYPGDAREEDTIMMAVRMQQNAIVNFEQINISGQTTIHSIPQDVVKGLNDETLQTNIEFKQRQAAYSCQTNYSELKKIISYIYDDKYRIAINSVSFAKDKEEDNNISGVIDISYYSLAGMNKEYVKPEMKDYYPGLADVFHATVDEDGNRIVVSAEE
ncbi:MAG: hypothetical protein IJ716_03290 [Lachnospiraceae bacterium]|nr:hypothetical protein [Lachnospiraceae bacterium]